LLTLGYYRMQTSFGWAAAILGLAAAGGLRLIPIESSANLNRSCFKYCGVELSIITGIWAEIASCQPAKFAPLNAN